MKILLLQMSHYFPKPFKRFGENILEKPKEVMKHLMQIKVECFGVAYGMKVKDIIEMQRGKKIEGRK